MSSPLQRLAAYELRPLLAGRGMWLAWSLLLFAGLLAIVQGHWQMQGQRDLIEQLPGIHQTDVEALRQRFPEGTDSGSMGYYLFLPAAHIPSGWADLAVGLRDTLPIAMKVRMLGLYSQLFDAELVNPQLAAAGSYDFAFFVLFIMPLWLLLLCHGVLARDEEDGTGSLLRAHASSLWRLLLLRIGLRWLLAWLLCVLLLALSLLTTAAEWDARAPMALLLIGLYLGFWAALCAAVVAMRRSRLWSATALLGLWALLVLILPQALAVWNERLHPVDDAAEIMLKQRDVTHTGWDLPKEVTFERFFEVHPEWRDTPPVTERFHWKWYFAMHHVGDESVRDDVARYREKLGERDSFTDKVAAILPSVGIQRGLTALAGTDLVDHLAYLDSVAALHDSLRAFFYPRLFGEEMAPFEHGDFDSVPQHQGYLAQPRWAWGAATGMLIWSLLLLGGAKWTLQRRLSR